ncbi:MAG: hypothetical protein JXI43_02175 [Tissierellales bacterium]|nr:hypothetical protein [Tissierellales bacterium]
MFIWNPYIRKCLGLGYVNWGLAEIPLLRQIILSPFRELLLADAALELFDEAKYFEHSQVFQEDIRKTSPIQKMIPIINGQIILVGESGLGKTMFLQSLLKRSKRIAAYLTADQCSKGIVQAIQLKLYGIASDTNFLKSLIYGGALDICIDGLNEVNADTRANITQFIKERFKGNVILTTQPIEWVPPASATVYILQPLQQDQIVTFLLSRYDMFSEVISASFEQFKERCETYLEDSFKEEQAHEVLTATRYILSNPMDATLVAQMLAHGKVPDIFHLEEQQYKIMSDDYKRIYLGKEFPLQAFSEMVYHMRLNDQNILPDKRFPDEIRCMERYKMVLKRQGVSGVFGEEIEATHINNQIVDFLTSLPNSNDISTQRALLSSAGLDERLLNQLSFTDSPSQFFPLLVSILRKYGTLEDGRDALEAVLESTKNYIGQEKRAYCDILVGELHKTLSVKAYPPDQVSDKHTSQTKKGDREYSSLWYFRHDKILEFFIVQTFLGVTTRPADHINDPRFRGVYFLLANLMPIDAAKSLRETLIQYAADTRDHTVSDNFIQLLRQREAAIGSHHPVKC